MKPAVYSIAALFVVSLTIALLIGAKHVSHAETPTSQPHASVKIDNFKFTPRELKIIAGTTVTWKNADDVPHTATSKDDSQTFDSATLDTDDTFSFTFKTPGHYSYYCKVHPHMTGTIIVK